MSATAIDLHANVEYRTDRWFMNRIPLALWLIALGLAFLLTDPAKALRGAGPALLYLGLLALAFAGWAGTSLLERSRYPAYLVYPATLILFIAVIGVIEHFSGPAGGRGYRSNLWSHYVNPPNTTFGWMMIDLGLVWIIVALVRHFYPPRPLLRLSRAGVSYHRAWLKDVFIPWHEIRRAGALTQNGARSPHAVGVAVDQAFYARQIAPRRSALSPPGAEAMFVPEGGLMQMILTCPELEIAPEDLSAPLEARWAALREQPAASPPPPEGGRGDIVYGQWAFDAPLGQLLRLLPPLIAIGAVIVLLVKR